MNGPEHYRLAEKWAITASDLWSEADDESIPDAQAAAAIAQVHATLALAAATAELDVYEGPTGGDGTGRTNAQVKAWQEAIR